MNFAQDRKKKSRLVPHPVISRIEIRYDPTEPLSAEDWPEFEEREEHYVDQSINLVVC